MTLCPIHDVELTEEHLDEHATELVIRASGLLDMLDAQQEVILCKVCNHGSNGYPKHVPGMCPILRCQACSTDPAVNKRASRELFLAELDHRRRKANKLAGNKERRTVDGPFNTDPGPDRALREGPS